MTRLVIAGGGLAGCLTALALAKRRLEIEVLLIEQGEAFGGNHTWSFFDTDVADEDRWVLDGIGSHHWTDHELRFPSRHRSIDIGYNSIRSVALDEAMRKAFRPKQALLRRRIQAVSPTAVMLEGGDAIEADAVIDARGPSTTPGLDLGWQKFVGLTCRFCTPHGVTKPVIMDATVEQLDGYRFIYQLPVSATELLIEDTYYSLSPVLDDDALCGRIGVIAWEVGGSHEVVAEERGVLPVVLSGEVASLWRGEAVPRIGVRGGFFHPTTSYSLPDAVRNASLLARQTDFTPDALHALFRARAEQLWRDRSFFRLLNRMLFRAAEPDEAYRVLEHFYRLPRSVVARFYSAQLTAIDKLRVLSGSPPVPITRALGALWSSAA